MNYTELKLQWGNYMHRVDLADKYDFVTALITARLGRELRVQENELFLESEVIDIALGVKLPDGFKKMRNVGAVFQGQERPLTFMSPVQFNSQLVTGRPQIYTMQQGYLFTKGAGPVTLHYWAVPADIVITEESPVLDAYPDLYLYAGLAELHRYTLDAQAATGFTEYYKTELRLCNKEAQKQRTGNSPVMRPR